MDLTPAGEPTTGYLVTVTPHRTVSIVIDYGHRTWSKTTYSFGSASDGRRPGPQPATQANLRLLTLAGAIPAGFTQASP